MSEDIIYLEERARNIISCEIIDIHAMSHIDSKYSISNRHIFCWKSFKIDIWNIDSICWKKKEIDIPSVFHSDILQIHWWQDLPTVCKLVGRWGESNQTQIYSGEKSEEKWFYTCEDDIS